MNPSSIIARPAARPRHSRQAFCPGPNLPCRTFYPAAVDVCPAQIRREEAEMTAVTHIGHLPNVKPS
jgi:hypothetical protein